METDRTESGGLIFAARILKNLYDAFPIPMKLDRERDMEAIVEYVRLREKLGNAERGLHTKKFFKDKCASIVASDSPEVSDEEKSKLTNIVESAEFNAVLDPRPGIVTDYRGRMEKMAKVWDGTIVFLKAEGYIREVEEKYQLTEKGLGHLHKRFSDAQIQSTDKSVIERLTEYYSNPENCERAVIKLMALMFV